MKRTTPTEYEFRTLTFTRETGRREALALLNEAAEYGRWELSRTRIGMGGKRTIRLRRRIIRMQRTA